MASSPSSPAPPRPATEADARPLARLWGAVALGALALAPFAAELAARLPACPVKRLAGWPCPACGSGRALVALAAFDPLAALISNPLAAVGAVLFLIGGLVALALSFTRWRLPPEPRELPLAARWSVIAALLANWLYLVGAGR